MIGWYVDRMGSVGRPLVDPGRRGVALGRGEAAQAGVLRDRGRLRGQATATAVS